MLRALLFSAALVGAAATLGARQGQPQGQRPNSQQPARDTPAQPATPAPSGRISGRVVTADSGRPVKRARVVLNAAEVPGGRGMVAADAGGYEIPELPA